MTARLPAPGTPLCALDDLADGQGLALRWGSGKDASGVIVLRSGASVTAYVNRCPHFGVPLDHQSKVTTFAQYVLCSQHYAAFRMADGACVEGPCQGASLAAVPIEIDGAVIRIAADSRSI